MRSAAGRCPARARLYRHRPVPREHRVPKLAHLARRLRLATTRIIVLVAALGCARVSIPTPGWQYTTPETAGLNHAALDSLAADIRAQRYPNVHALLIEIDGRLAYETYFAGDDVRRGHGRLGHVVFTPETLHDIRSISKSVTSALVGIAIGSGAIRSVDQPILDFFPAYADLATPEKRSITIRHALTMATGLQWDEALSYADTTNDERRLNRSTDPFRTILSRPVVTPPGSQFNYSAASTQLLLGAVQHAVRMPVVDYARDVLFAPLGITDVEWVFDSPGLPSAASGLRLRPRDLAKIGSLYLNGGRWQGRQIIPEEWVATSLRRQIDLPPQQSDSGRHGYGFQWWQSRFAVPGGEVEVSIAAGNGGQNIFVLPKQRMVVTILGGRYDRTDWINEDILLERILPALAPASARAR